MNHTDVPPVVGTRYRAIADPSSHLSDTDAPVISIKPGTTLEIVTTEEKWDNYHADIFRSAHVEVTLRIVQPPGAVEIPLVVTGMSLTRANGPEPTTWVLPYWLVLESDA